MIINLSLVAHKMEISFAELARRVGVFLIENM